MLLRCALVCSIKLSKSTFPEPPEAPPAAAVAASCCCVTAPKSTNSTRLDGSIAKYSSACKHGTSEVRVTSAHRWDWEICLHTFIPGRQELDNDLFLCWRENRTRTSQTQNIATCNTSDLVHPQNPPNLLTMMNKCKSTAYVATKARANRFPTSSFDPASMARSCSWSDRTWCADVGV